MSYFFYFFCTLILFQDIIGITLFNIGISGHLLKIFLSLKDLLMIILICLNTIIFAMIKKRWVINMTIFCFVSYSAVVFFYFFFFSNSKDALQDLRALIFPVYAYLAGYTSFYMDKNCMLKWLEKMAFFSVIISLSAYTLGKYFYVDLNVLKYTEFIKGFYGLIFNGLPSTFFGNFANMTIFRLAGPILNPIGTANLFIFVLAILYSSYRIGNKKFFMKLLLGLLALAIFLTFSRGPIVALILGIVITDIIWTKRLDTKNIYIYTIFFLLIAILYGTFSNMFRETFMLRDPSTKSHLEILLSSLTYIKDNWLGTGVGSFGKWRMGASVALGGESSFAAIVGQVGIIAFIFMVGAYFSIFKNLINNKSYEINYGLSVFLIVTLFDSIFSTSMLSVTSHILFWFFVGYAEYQCNKKYEDRA